MSETFQDALEVACRWLFWIGVGATAFGAGFMFYYCFASGDETALRQMASNVSFLNKVLYAGLVAISISSTIMWWGEQVLAPIQILGAAALWSVPFWLPSLGLANPPTVAAQEAMAALQTGGMIFGGIGVAVLAGDISVRAKDRFKLGAKADQIKLGKGVKEESDRQDVFLGKCWQLPFCRKFVREKCPIYHSRRTCWRELVGCMCEEDVIRGAMEGRVISKDALVAAQMIPRNHKLTDGQKKERCKTCVIYNEHQKHKYRASVWGILGGSIGIYLLLHGPLVTMTENVIARAEQIVRGLTVAQTKTELAQQGWFAEGLLVVFFILGISYAMKLLEYLIFTLKV
ncbi:MAG TPA: hypothetical protein VKT78_12305 [Fimbriimonadaceae bacterium]|nr:hypothetical protein [Fimbriimonadaceae bacterium]